MNVVKPRPIQIVEASAILKEPQGLLRGANQEAEIGSLLRAGVRNPRVLLAFLETHITRKDKMLHAQPALMK